MFRFSQLMLVSMIVAFTATSAFAAGKPAAAKNAGDTATIETTLGTIKIRFFPDKAPGHVANFKKLARAGFYDGTTFHRVIPGFMI